MSENKRRRLQKTSHEQYEEYLRLMEEDQIFRTGTINPSVSQNYLEDSWTKLTTRLNASGNGPALTAIEWKKRFNDWKNSTRAKYRKMSEERKRTGGGPSAAVSLSPLEERGLSVWGRITVTGTPKVLISGGFHSETCTSNEGHQVPEVNFPENVEELDIELMEENQFQEVSVAIDSQHPDKESKPLIVRQEKQTKFPKRKIPPGINKTVRSVRSIGEDLLNTYKENALTNEKMRLELEERKISLEERKFKFEIAKYKFENPTFNFNE